MKPVDYPSGHVGHVSSSVEEEDWALLPTPQESGEQDSPSAFYRETEIH